MSVAAMELTPPSIDVSRCCFLSGTSPSPRGLVFFTPIGLTALFHRVLGSATTPVSFRRSRDSVYRHTGWTLSELWPYRSLPFLLTYYGSVRLLRTTDTLFFLRFYFYFPQPTLAPVLTSLKYLTPPLSCFCFEQILLVTAPRLYPLPF